MFLRVSIAVFLLSLSVCGVLGASVSVNVTDTKMTAENATNMDNSTKSLNTSGNVLTIRAIDVQLQSLNTSDDKSLNSTLNSTSSSMEEREIDDAELLLLLEEDGNSTQAGNSSESAKSENVEVERATVEVTGNETLRLNATEEQAANNQTTRQVSVNATSDANATITKNSTANPWSVLPLFRNLNASLLNSSASLNSSETKRQATLPKNSTSTEDDEDVSDEPVMSETTDKTSLKVDESDDGLDEDLMDEEGVSTKKPCSTVSCMISRGCTSDDSCTPQ